MPDGWTPVSNQSGWEPVESKTAPPSALQTLADLATGFGKGAVHTVIDAGQLMNSPLTNAVGNAAGGLAGRLLYGTKAEPVPLNSPAFEDARKATDYTNPIQQGGGALETLAELAVPVTKGVEAIPSTARAGRGFQDVMSLAKNVPVDVSAPGDVALRIQQLAERGGSMPMAVRKFLQRVTDPQKPPLTYEEARDFASNISRLSADEYGRLTPVISREVANLRVALNQAVGEAAAKAGKGAEYAQAMEEYAKAMKFRDVLSKVWEGAKRAALPGAGLAGAGYYVANELKKLMGN